MILALRAAIEMSARRATTSPAPTAGPWIADTIGFEHSMTLRTRSLASCNTLVRTAKSVVICSMRSKLPPAEKAEPALDQRDSHGRVAVDGGPHVGEVSVGVAADGVEAGPVEDYAQDTFGRGVEAQARKVVAVVRHCD